MPKERHVRKEGNGSTLWLSNGPKESHDSTVVKKLFQKRVMTAVLVLHDPKESNDTQK